MAKIVIIADDPDILDASTLVLHSKGYEVNTAANPNDGYKLVKETKPDLIILDVMMNEPEAVNRGHETHVGTFLDKPLSEVICINCGQCINRCPTSA